MHHDLANSHKNIFKACEGITGNILITFWGSIPGYNPSKLPVVSQEVREVQTLPIANTSNFTS